MSIKNLPARVRHFYLPEDIDLEFIQGCRRLKAGKVLKAGAQILARDFDVSLDGKVVGHWTEYWALGGELPASTLVAFDQGQDDPPRTLDDACDRLPNGSATACELVVRQLVAEGKLSIDDFVSAYHRTPKEV